jgi:hypothetical protein
MGKAAKAEFKQKRVLKTVTNMTIAGVFTA